MQFAIPDSNERKTIIKKRIGTIEKSSRFDPDSEEQQENKTFCSLKILLRFRKSFGLLPKCAHCCWITKGWFIELYLSPKFRWLLQATQIYSQPTALSWRILRCSLQLRLPHLPGRQGLSLPVSCQLTYITLNKDVIFKQESALLRARNKPLRHSAHMSLSEGYLLPNDSQLL